MGALGRALWIGGAITGGLFAIIVLIIPIISFVLVFGLISGIAYVVIKDKETHRQSRDITIIRPPD